MEKVEKKSQNDSKLYYSSKVVVDDGKATIIVKGDGGKGGKKSKNDSKLYYSSMYMAGESPNDIVDVNNTIVVEKVENGKVDDDTTIVEKVEDGIVDVEFVRENNCDSLMLANEIAKGSAESEEGAKEDIKGTINYNNSTVVSMHDACNIINGCIKGDKNDHKDHESESESIVMNNKMNVEIVKDRTDESLNSSQMSTLNRSLPSHNSFLFFFFSFSSSANPLGSSSFFLFQYNF